MDKAKIRTLEFVVLGVLILWAGHWFVYSFRHYERDGIAAVIGGGIGGTIADPRDWLLFVALWLLRRERRKLEEKERRSVQ